MLLLDNPFYLLQAGPEEDRDRLNQKTEDLSLKMEGTEAALAGLTHPLKRLEAEMAWLPGVPPPRRREILAALEKKRPLTPGSVEDLPPLAGCNLAASFLTRYPDLSDNLLSDWALDFLPRVYDRVHLGDLMAQINLDRQKAGFSPVRSPELVAEALKALEDRYLAAVCAALGTRSTAECIILVADMVRNESEEFLPHLSLRLMEVYETEALAFFDRQATAIRALGRGVAKLADFRRLKSPLTEILSGLWQAAAEWEYIARPLIMGSLHQGLRHESSEEMAGGLLNLSADLSNEFHNHKLADYLNNILLALFPHLEIAQIARDNKKIFVYDLGWTGSWKLEGTAAENLPIYKKARAEKGLSGLSQLVLTSRDYGGLLAQTADRQPKPLTRWGDLMNNFIWWVGITTAVTALVWLFG